MVILYGGAIDTKAKLIGVIDTAESKMFPAVFLYNFVKQYEETVS